MTAYAIEGRRYETSGYTPTLLLPVAVSSVRPTDD